MVRNTVVGFAEQWSTVGHVADDVLMRLKATLSAEELIILAATVAQANYTCRFNHVFGVELL